jgi:hypothetical protein
MQLLTAVVGTTLTISLLQHFRQLVRRKADHRPAAIAAASDPPRNAFNTGRGR